MREKLYYVDILRHSIMIKISDLNILRHNIRMKISDLNIPPVSTHPRQTNNFVIRGHCHQWVPSTDQQDETRNSTPGLLRGHAWRLHLVSLHMVVTSHPPINHNSNLPTQTICNVLNAPDMINSIQPPLFPPAYSTHFGTS